MLPATAQENKVNVYPGRWVYETFGCGSLVLNQALACWAHTIIVATKDNEARFTPDEWNSLAACLYDTEIDPRVPWPGQIMAEIVRDHTEFEGAAVLAAKCHSMDYPHAWAAIISVQVLLSLKEETRAAEEWWTLDWRRAKPRGRLRPNYLKNRPKEKHDAGHHTKGRPEGMD